VNPQGSECGCAACGQVFTGLTLFDAHQDVNYAREPVIACRPPAWLGLVQDARGTWGTPAGLKARESYATRLAGARPGQGAA
jgi:hypothetical protein